MECHLTLFATCARDPLNSDNGVIFVITRAMQNCCSQFSAVLVQLGVLYRAVLFSLVEISSWFVELLNVAHLVLSRCASKSPPL